MTSHSSTELTKASDELARVVAELLPHDADPTLAARFRTALGNLLASTLSGATVMAAGAVVMVNDKVDRLAQVRREQVQELQLDIDHVSDRVHKIEDEFSETGSVPAIETVVHKLAIEVEQIKARQAGDDAAE